MPVRVEHPVLGIVELPDGTTQEEVEQRLLQIGAATMPEESSGAVFFNQMGEGITSSIEGLGVFDTAYEDEFVNRVQLEQSPYAGYGGLLVGSILDPVTLPAAFLKPVTFGSKVATGIARGGIAGAAGGAVEPVFEQFGDDRLLNTTVGAAFGGALGGALSRFIARDVTPPTKADTEEGVDAALENVAEAVTPTRTKTVDEVRQEIDDELSAQSKQGITPETEAVIQKGIDERLAKVEQIEKAAAKRTKGLRATDDKEAGQQALGRFEEIRTRLMDEVREMRLRIKRGQEGRAAGEELANLRTGQIDKLKPETQARLIPQTVEEPTLKQPKVEEATPQQPTVQVTQQVAQPVTQAAEQTAEEFAPLQMGFEPRTSAGSAGVRPEQRYAGQAAEGVDETELVSSAWSRKMNEPAGDVGFDLPEQELRRAGQRQSAASERLQDLMGHKFGAYTFDYNPQMEAEVKSLIGEDFDSLVDWLIDAGRKGKVFNYQEQRLLEPLRAEAEQRIATTYKAMRKMRSQGGYKSTEYTDAEYDAVMDLQFYSYVADIIDTNGTRASHALKEIQNIKNNRRKNAARIKRGDAIDDIFGVKC